MYVVAIIAAAGEGRRMAGPGPKQLLDLGGRSMLERSVDLFDDAEGVHEIIVAAPPDVVASPPIWLRRMRKPVRVVPGGSRRQDSVANAFERLPAHADLVVVHDAARPLASPRLIARTIEAAARTGAAIAALPARDTVKESALGPDGAVVARTLPRESIFLAQTPQAFRRDVLGAAIALGRAGASGTDEAALAEQAGHPVRLVAGEDRNLKITTADDLMFARLLLAGSGPSRAGAGYDLHRLVEGRPLVLGGVTIPFERGPLGHSDGDAVCHAITDAILGAAGAGSIGQHFPDTDPRWAGASSLDLLKTACELIRRSGFAVANVDAVVVLERPKLAPYVPEMTVHLARALDVQPGCVSVKGKTNEGMDAIGRGEAVAVHAVALLRMA